MLLRLIGGLILAASAVDATVVAHELLKTRDSAAAARIADGLMPLDEANNLRRESADESVSDANLRAALLKDPWDTRSRIELSVHAELRGNRNEAEQALREAAAHDIGREPRWALANFYFRQHDTAQVIAWTNQYRAVTHDREQGLFRMLAQVLPDGAAWPAQLPHMGCDELKTAVDVLGEREQAADALVDRMTVACRDEASTRELSGVVSDLLLRDDFVRAGTIWRQMGRPVTLANADFSQPISGEGFDWRLNESPFVDARLVKGDGVEFNLADGVTSGTVLLFQPELLEAGSLYRLTMSAQSEPAAPGAFRWELVELSTGRHLPSELDDEEIHQQLSWAFHAPRTSTKTLALALYYKRPEGSTSFSGKMTLHAVQLSRNLTVAAPALRTE